MDAGQNALNQAALAREQINQQIKNHREIIAAAREQVKGMIEMQITAAKEEHSQKAAEAAKEAVQAQMAAKQQNPTSLTPTKTHAQLAKLILLLSEGTGVNHSEATKQTLEATEAASKVLDKVAQVFNPPSDDT